MSLRVISDTEYKERDGVLVASPVRIFPTDIEDTCHECGKNIYYRPYSSHFTKKICLACCLEKHGHLKDTAISKQSLDEIRELQYRRRPAAG